MGFCFQSGANQAQAIYSFMSDNNKCSVQRPIRILHFSYFFHHAFNPIEGNQGSLPHPIISFNCCFLLLQSSTVYRHEPSFLPASSSNSRLLLRNQQTSAPPQSVSVISPCKYTVFNRAALGLHNSPQ